MVALVIFWASFFCLVFFLLGAICKGLASAFNALLSSLGLVLAIAFFAGAGAVLLYLLHDIIAGIITSGLLEMIGAIVLYVIVISLIVAVVGSIGAFLLEVAVYIGLLIRGVISYILEGAAGLCEKAYGHFLLAITNRLEKC